ncbi:MAG: MBL fold metallo-hydrolase [Candidatus Aureabacteria bacterium]|nr:MBL fold metallo-hydrolase [Candidatus Auribacterota bacterium]
MKIKIIFDKETKNKKLYTGWGVSFLIDSRILFDTGEKGKWILKNMKTLDVDIGKIESVVISHDHWDHTGGLWDLLKEKEGLDVYACPHFSSGFKKKVVKLKGELREAETLTEIAENIFVTGEIAGEYKGQFMPEQALIVKTENGLTVAAGCSHPSIIKVLEKIRNDFPGEDIYLVFGGFHLMDEDKRVIEFIMEEFRKMRVQKAGPTHCSGKEAEDLFKEEYGDDFIHILVGEELEV